jgi:protein associated with RNAse G/E
MSKNQILVIKKDHLGKEVWQYPGIIRRKTEKGILIAAIFNAKDHAYGFKNGDQFLELYLFDKWFNIYEIHDRDDRKLKCWYCNITRPVHLLDDTLSYDDLALDLLVYPDGKQRLLDEDEFGELSLSKNDRKKAMNGMQELRELFCSVSPMNLNSLI